MKRRKKEKIVVEDPRGELKEKIIMSQETC